MEWNAKFLKLKNTVSQCCEIDGTSVAKRLQFQIKLGYATTVDKAQGRTIAGLV